MLEYSCTCGKFGALFWTELIFTSSQWMTDSLEDLLAKIYKVWKVKVYLFVCLFVCTEAVPRSTAPAIHQRHILCGAAQERMSHSSGPKSLQVYKKGDNRDSQMSSKTWHRIWSASVKITDLRKCLFWKTMCESGTTLPLKLRYATNTIKSKQQCHLKTQRTYFTLTIKMFLSYCLSWNEICRIGISCRIFQFCRKLLCFRIRIVGFFVLVVFIILVYQDFIISLKNIVREYSDHICVMKHLV